jgi:hypothetical protein
MLPNLDLSNQNIQNIVGHSFNGTPSLKFLNLQGNVITNVETDAFLDLPNLTLLNIENNPNLEVISSDVFQPVFISSLRTDRFAFCCAANQDGIHARECSPRPDEFSSCSDLLANGALQIAIWVLAFLGLLGNLFVLVWRLMHRKEGGVENAMVVSLSLADLLMGIYLIIVASADVHYRGVYVIYAERWKSSVVCTLAGFMSFVSSEMSVFMLVLITTDRVIAIVFAFKIEKLTIRKVLVILPVAWFVVILLGLVPIWVPGMYGANGVCLPFSFSSRSDRMGIFFLSMNLLAFLLIALGYIMIYYTIRQSRRRIEKLGKQQDNKRDLAFLKKMSVVILSDLLCWVPIVILKYITLGGIRLLPEVSAWTAVFVLPLNSSLNPHLYTISAVRANAKRASNTGTANRTPRKTRSSSETGSSGTMSSRLGSECY